MNPISTRNARNRDGANKSAWCFQGLKTIISLQYQSWFSPGQRCVIMIPRSSSEKQDKQLGAELAAGQRVTWIGVGLNLLLSGVKLTAGLLGRSQALIADAAHSFSDMVTDLVVLVGLRLGRRSADDRHQFGHGRLETMATLVVGLLLCGAGVAIGYDAINSIYFHQAQEITWLAPAAAGVSILVNELLYHYTVRVGRRINSALLRANAWHHRSDAMSSLAALAGTTAAMINPDWRVLDPVAALVVSVMVIKVAYGITAEAVAELSDSAPSAEVLQTIENCALSVAGVISIHDLRVRRTGGVLQAELHVVVDGELSVLEGHRIAKETEACLFDDVANLGRIIVHMDPSQEEAGV